MKPSELGKKYDKIAQWWHEQHALSSYGVSQFERAVGFATGGEQALDVGCGAGGRFVRILQNSGFSVTGLDVSKEMVMLASKNHQNKNLYIKIFALGKQMNVLTSSLHGIVFFTCHLLCKSLLLLSYVGFWRKMAYYYIHLVTPKENILINGTMILFITVPLVLMKICSYL